MIKRDAMARLKALKDILGSGKPGDSSTPLDSGAVVRRSSIQTVSVIIR